ncbi:MAG: serine/threonine-protein kinase [bacterium]|nr:serine/threonine-protein kinase [bacterium]
MNNTPLKFVGKYQIIKQISRTPQALTFLSKSPITNAPAVIKLYPNKLAQTQGFMKQFLSEMSHIKELEHPNILPINHYELTDKFPSIDMPYMAGGNLEKRIQANTNLVHFKDAINQIFPALIYAHRQGMIHGNIKPTNILFDQKGNSYLSDFQLRCVVQHHEATNDSLWMSPEQIHSGKTSQASDVYSLGMVIFAWITGQMPPYWDSPVSEHDYEPLSLKRYISNVSVGMDEVIRQATEYHPSERYASMKSFSQAFFDALRTDKFFLGMVSSVKSDVTEFSGDSKLDDMSYSGGGGGGGKPYRRSLLEYLTIFTLGGPIASLFSMMGYVPLLIIAVIFLIGVIIVGGGILAVWISEIIP